MKRWTHKQCRRCGKHRNSRIHQRDCVTPLTAHSDLGCLWWFMLGFVLVTLYLRASR